MAQQYVLADEMFPTEFGGSFTAHLTLVAGTDDIKLPGRSRGQLSQRRARRLRLAAGNEELLHRRNAVSQAAPLARAAFRASISSTRWRRCSTPRAFRGSIYATNLLDAGFWEPFEAIKYVRYGPDWPNVIIAPQTNVLDGRQPGQLASVSWVTPSHADSDHPRYHSDAGPSWVASVVNAIGESSYWPTAQSSWFGTIGAASTTTPRRRSPTIAASAFAFRASSSRRMPNRTTSRTCSTSTAASCDSSRRSTAFRPGASVRLLKGYTDGRAASLDDAFDFTQTPRQFTPIGSKYPMSHFLHEPPSNEPVDTE